VAAEPASSFAELLRHLRRGAGLTQEELAAQARVGARSVSDLERGISTAPRRDTVALLAEALRLDARNRAALEAAAQAGRARLASAAARIRPHRLPTLPNALIGREDERARLAELLSQRSVRLVTLTGSPGIGKTSLAIQVATDLVARTPVAFVAVAAIREPERVLPAIATELGLVDTGERPVVETLREHLGRSALLLVVDNLEQVLGAATLLGELIAGCPELTLLATSRARLHLRNEHEFALPALGLPEPGAGAAVERSAALALFVERARAGRPDFPVDDATLPVLAQICRRLDGVPLAIELAAARTRLLSPRQLLNRLDRSLAVLVGGAQDLPERQRTLRAAIAWSYDLLDPAERALFRRLAVFAGGWTLEAAEQTCGLATDAVLDGLSSLVDKSLVWRRANDDGSVRFGLLETLREFGLERLSGEDDETTQRDRHAHRFAAYAERAEKALQGPDQPEWLSRLQEEHDNIRAALDWACASGQVTLGLRLAAAMWRFWEAYGHLAEGSFWLGQLLDLDDRRGPDTDAAGLRVRADALHADGTMALRQGDYPRSAARMVECLSIRRRLDDVPGVVVALNGVANSAVYQGDYPRAGALYQEALDLARTVPLARHVAALLGNLAFIARDRGDYARAESLERESLQARREMGDAAGEASALNGLGDSALRRGAFAEAEAYQQECLQLYQRLHNPVGCAYAVMSIAEIAVRQGDPQRAGDLAGESLVRFRTAGDRRGCALALQLCGEAARDRDEPAQAQRCLDESLELFRATTDRPGVIAVLEARARLSVSEGEPESAARLYGLAAAMRDALGLPVWAVDSPRHEREIGALGRHAAVFAAARALGPARPGRPDPVDVPALLAPAGATRALAAAPIHRDR
jgi:predicted ATPase/DNA-binding XRE family transcriptional regulator